jgi:hypothetical protein
MHDLPWFTPPMLRPQDLVTLLFYYYGSKTTTSRALQLSIELGRYITMRWTRSHQDPQPAI